MSKLSDLYVDITVKSNVSELKKIDDSMDALGKTAKEAAKEVSGMEKAFGGLSSKEIDKATKSFKDLGGSLTKKVTLPLAAGLGASVKTVMDFDYTMADVKAKTQATNEEFEKLRNNAREVAATSIFNPQEVAAAQAGLASAGLDPEEITQTVSHSLNLATTQNIDPDQASKLITTSMAQFDIDSSGAEGIADILAATATKTNMDNALVIGESLAVAGATAKSANTGLAETAAIFGTLANVGLEGSKAGTAFNAFQRELVANTSKTGKNHVKIGNKVVDAYDKQTGQMRSLGNILADVTDATEGMSDSARDAALQDIFSGQAMQMVKMFGQAGVESFRDIEAELAGLEDGFVQGMADTKMDNLKGSWESMKSSITDAFIAIGDVVKGPLKEAADTISRLTEKFRELDPETQEMIVKFALVAMAIGPAISMFGSLTGAIAGIPAKIETMKTAFTLMTSPVGLAIMGIVAAGIILYKNWDKIKAGAIALKDGASAAWESLKSKSTETWEGIKSAVTDKLDAMKEKWKSVKNFFKNPIKGTVSIMQNIKEKISGSHYQGIGYIPKDNYLANLHEGEMVLDKANAGFIRSIFGMGKGRTSGQDISKKAPTAPLEKIPTAGAGSISNNNNILEGIELPDFAPQIDIILQGGADDGAVEKIKREVEQVLGAYGEEFVTKIFNQLMKKLTAQLL